MAYNLTPFEKDLAVGNKMTEDEAYKEIKLLVKDLKNSRKKNREEENEQQS
jgi:hypothetical protein